MLGSRGLGNPSTVEGDYRFLTSGDPEALRASGTRFLQLPLGPVEHVALQPSSPRCSRRACASAQRRPGGGRAAAGDDRARVRAAPRPGSALITCGGTRVICTASVQESVPRWMAGKGRGWMTAEYGMLPASTGERKQRDISKGKQDGRGVEIQRLIGRSLRGVADLEALGERTIYIDCDVLEADGGTRCAAITGGYVALALATRRLQERGPAHQAAR